MACSIIRSANTAARVMLECFCKDFTCTTRCVLSEIANVKAAIGNLKLWTSRLEETYHECDHNHRMRDIAKMHHARIGTKSSMAAAKALLHCGPVSAGSSNSGGGQVGLSKSGLCQGFPKDRRPLFLSLQVEFGGLGVKDIMHSPKTDDEKELLQKYAWMSADGQEQMSIV
uniref:Predicted protein n=1 Tax=Physcomitrium patens TaxID=3218 RepID=A9U1V9_PHYPA